MTLTSGTNVGILRNAPGHQVFACFVEQAKPAPEPPPDFSDKEADNMELQEETESVDSTTDLTGLRGGPAVHPSAKVVPPFELDSSVKPHGDSSDEDACPDLLPFDLDHDEKETNFLSKNDDATSSLDAKDELMQWHLRLGHLPFANIRLMAARKEIPSWLLPTAGSQSTNLVSMDELPSVIGALKVKLVPFSQSRLQDSVSQWTNLSLQWLVSLGRTRDTSSARVSRWLRYLWITSVDSPISTCRSQQRMRKRWLPNGHLKPTLPLMVSRSDTTMPTMED
jgi:hypothetical protein